MSEAKERAQELDSQLSELLSLVSRDDFAELYDGDIDETKELLKEHLTTLRTDLRQMSDVEAENFFDGDPRFDNVKRRLIRDVEAIGVDFEFEINPTFEAIANQLAEKAEKVDAQDKNLLEQAFETLDKAIATVSAPIVKAATLATAIKTLLAFFEAIPK